jgi:hypothetical protein
VIDAIIINIAQALSTEFGDGVTIYTDQVRQKFTEPAFYIKDLTASEDQIVGNRYMRRTAINVHYFPQSKTEPRAEIRGVIEGLYQALEYIGVGSSLIKGRRMRYEIQDDVLHFLVDYDITIRRTETPGDPMDEIIIIQ